MGNEDVPNETARKRKMRKKEGKEKNKFITSHLIK
jgi:hypothetical protein